MRKLLSIITVAVTVFLLLMPLVAHAQSDQTTTGSPPVAQPLVREGDLALSLVEALQLGHATSETEAESMLGDAGIAPRNGWIADYPVTPDIIGELRKSVGDAADSKRIEIGKEEALQAFQNVVAGDNLSVRPYTSGETYEKGPPKCENYPNPAVVNNYYSSEGPPVVTYYAPPPDYYYLYNWVPYPFWWFDFWFPGFFVLIDFHKVVIVHNHVNIITNHFVDRDTHRVFRIDPGERFRGRTFAGIGAPSTGRFLSTGSRRGAETIFNPGRRFAPPSEERRMAPAPTERRVGPPSGGRVVSPQGERRTGTPPGERSFTPPSGGKVVSPPPGGRSFGPPSGGGRAVVPPSGEGGSSRQFQRR